METVRQRLYRVALDKGLRQSTVIGYEHCLQRLRIMDAEADSLVLQDVLDRLWQVDSPNVRRSIVICLRSVMGWQIKIPKQMPKRYVLPTEDTLRMALMFSPHEARGLLMMYAGLRIGEACAITAADRTGDRLSVDKQVLELHRKGQPITWRVAPVKSSEASIVIPLWLGDVVDTLHETVKPNAVRESIRRGGQKVGVSLNPHMLRHWYGTTMLERGLPLALVSKQMRHSDIAVTLRTYAQFNDGDIHKAFG